jgi:hypothetical protein
MGAHAKNAQTIAGDGFAFPRHWIVPASSEETSMSTLRRCFTLIAAAGLVACAARPGQDGPRERRDQNVLTPAELQTEAGRTLYDHIRRVRPQWLEVRAPTALAGASAGLIIYRDGVRIGGVDTLRDMVTDLVESARFLTGPEAQSRVGLDHQYGAILVTTRH